MPKARQGNQTAKRKTKKKTMHYDIGPTTRISDILELVPDAAEIFALHGLHCAGCQFQTSDTLEEGMGLHGKNDGHLTALLEDLQHGLPEGTKRPATIVVTRSAAEGLREALREQGKEGWMLLVMTDETGGFCMEFVRSKTPEHLVFNHPEVPEVLVIASEKTLASIGGSTIDFRDGRFKLDMPDSGGCGCKKSIEN